MFKRKKYSKEDEEYFRTLARENPQLNCKELAILATEKIDRKRTAIQQKMYKMMYYSYLYPWEAKKEASL